nr:DDE transposase [Aneurinibacillus terranovensis]
MIPVARSHEAYLQFVVEQLHLQYGESKAFLQQFYADLILWITPVDLSLTSSLMKDQYSPNPKGSKPRDPTDLLRSLLLMNKLHITKKKRKLKKPKKKGKKNQKQEPNNPNITEKLLGRIQRQGQIHGIATVSVNSLIPMPTGVGTVRRERYFYDRHLYMFTAADSHYHLPLYPRLFKASQHDAVSWVCGYHEFLHWYPQWNIGEMILDSAHDASPIYSCLESHHVSTIIELNPRKATQFTYNEMDIGLDGVPICPIGRKMMNWGKEAKRYRRKWRCPAKVGKWECPHPCSTSDYGRTFHTSTADNPRLFPRVPRDSKEWRNRYKLRTGVERCVKRQKIDYKLEDSKGRSSRHWNIRIYSIAMCQHADAWFEEAKKQKLSSLDQWFAANQAA